MTERHPSIDPVHPGQILREDILPALAMSKKAVAAALGVSRQTLYDILNEQQPVTAEMAVRFGMLGNGSGFWSNLQRSHDLAVQERTVDVSGIPTLALRVPPDVRARRPAPPLVSVTPLSPSVSRLTSAQAHQACAGRRKWPTLKFPPTEGGPWEH